MKIWWCEQHRCSADSPKYTCHNNNSRNLCRIVPLHAIPADKPFQIVFEPEEQHYYFHFLELRGSANVQS